MLAVAFTAAVVQAGYKDDIGYNQLADELGGSLPTGTNITVSHIEAPPDGTNYMPDISLMEFLGKTFTNISASATGVSDHATGVGQYFYGTNTSIAPDINSIYNYEVSHWLGSGFLWSGSANEPAVETNRIQNHSWIGTGTNAVRRLDYAIDHDGFTAIAGLNNSTSTPIPQIFAHCYNAISVGRSDGQHSTGYTTFEGPGRTKPEIVVPKLSPQNKTSYCVPVVGAAAALLMETADNNSALTNANKPQCIKAILLAGATKDEFPSWERTPARPLDETYGAGELNIYNSYHVLSAGEQEASTTSLVERLGWDFCSIPGNTNALYFFQVPESNVMTRFSAIVTWHREITNGPPLYLPESLADLNLHLHEVTNFTLSSLIDSSTSGVDNVEHIYRRNMCSGRYALEITADATTDCALAWFSRTALIPELQSITMTNGNVRFESSVSAGIPYGIEASTNLLGSNGWVRIDTNTSSTNVLIYTDADSTNFSQRFYRLVPDPW